MGGFFRKDVAPGRNHGGVQARTDEGQRGLEDDRVCNQNRSEDQNRSSGIAHHVLDEDPRCTSTGDDHCTHVVFTVCGHHVCANNTCQLRDVDKGDREDDHHHKPELITRLGKRTAEDQNRNSRHCDTGDRHDDVQDTHDGFGDGLARHGCDRTNDCTEEEGNDGRGDTDEQ